MPPVLQRRRKGSENNRLPAPRTLAAPTKIIVDVISTENETVDPSATRNSNNNAEAPAEIDAAPAAPLVPLLPATTSPISEAPMSPNTHASADLTVILPDAVAVPMVEAMLTLSRSPEPPIPPLNDTARSESLMPRLDSTRWEFWVSAYLASIWNAQYKSLVEFKGKNGHCSVPLDYGPLGRWVKEQRAYYHSSEEGNVPSSFTPVNIKRLEDLGLEWRLRAKRKFPEENVQEETATKPMQQQVPDFVSVETQPKEDDIECSLMMGDGTISVVDEEMTIGL